MTRNRPLAAYRVVIAGVVIALAAITFLYLRGPAFWQRWYYPLPEAHRASIAESADRHRLNPYLIAAVIDSESAWDASAVSEAGAVGLMQLLPETARDIRDRDLVSPRFDPGELSDAATNIEFGAAYIRLLVERYHELEVALAAYNAGMGNVDGWVEQGGDIRDSIEFPETRHFVLRVARARDVYERLYPGVFDEAVGEAR